MKTLTALTLLLLTLTPTHNAYAETPAPTGTPPPPETATMTAHFIDVGQGEATLLEFSCGAVLIDAGAQDPTRVDDLVDYLRHFFERRTDLADTLDLVIITHNHPGHTRGLTAVFESFVVKHYVDNGHPATTEISGAQEWVRLHVPSEIIREVSAIEIAALDHRNGLTDGAIDPVQCSGVDPVIRVLAARHLSHCPTSFARIRPPREWTGPDYAEEDNQSLIIRVDFGAFSLLFTGDLSGVAIGTLIDYYRSGGLLDVDLYVAGDHGGRRATSDALLDEMTPEMAVISVGDWRSYETRKEGKPSLATWASLEAKIPGKRAHPKWARLAVGPYRFKSRKVRSRIYATAWDGVIRVTARSDGTSTIETSRWRCARVSIPR